MTDDEFEAIEDEILLAEVQRRVANDSGVRYSLADVLAELDLTVDDLEPDGPRRVWTYAKGQWNPERWTRWAKPVFMSEDEFGNDLICLRLPQGRLLLLALNVPLKAGLYDPDRETP